jgi:putative transposase
MRGPVFVVVSSSGTTQGSNFVHLRIVELATTHGRYGCWLITGLIRNEGWNVNHKRVQRLWRKKGLKVPKKQPRRGRLWLNDGSCVRLRTGA